MKRIVADGPYTFWIDKDGHHISIVTAATYYHEIKQAKVQKDNAIGMKAWWKALQIVNSRAHNG